ncbi:MAG: orotidine-5'-phosphate decarboxylase [Candidatus Micrarchaeota archaeon]
MNFTDALIAKIQEKNSRVCVGLDPRYDNLPPELKPANESRPEVAAAFLEFNKAIIDAIEPHASIVKPQVAFYEVYGSEGVRAFEQTIAYAKSKGLLVLIDGKRNDIGSTAAAYARAFFDDESFAVDALTVNGYLGFDGIKPFIDYCKNDKGIFVLVKTSNPSSIDFQDVYTNSGKLMYEMMAENVVEWGADCFGDNNYSSVGAVVGATFPQQATKLRKIMPKSFFLVPGYGAQGGTAKDTKPCFNDDGLGAIVNSSRGIIFAYEKQGDDFAKAAGSAAEKMKNEINAVLGS